MHEPVQAAGEKPPRRPGPHRRAHVRHRIGDLGDDLASFYMRTARLQKDAYSARRRPHRLRRLEGGRNAGKFRCLRLPFDDTAKDQEVEQRAGVPCGQGVVNVQPSPQLDRDGHGQLAGDAGLAQGHERRSHGFLEGVAAGATGEHHHLRIQQSRQIGQPGPVVRIDIEMHVRVVIRVQIQDDVGIMGQPHQYQLEMLVGGVRLQDFQMVAHDVADSARVGRWIFAKGFAHGKHGLRGIRPETVEVTS